MNTFKETAVLVFSLIVQLYSLVYAWLLLFIEFVVTT